VCPFKADHDFILCTLGNKRGIISEFTHKCDRKLRKNKCSRTHQQIKHSLEIMNKCILTVYEDNKEIYTGAILQDYCSVDKVYCLLVF
jgi:hypothetical protein